MITVIPPLEGERPKTYRRDRVCSSCSTVLSIYNPRHRCAQCDPLPQPMKLREHAEAMAELVDLMESIE